MATASPPATTVAIPFSAPPEVLDALTALGRTEDVRLSPSGRRLALACYARERIALVDVDIGRSAEGPTVALTRLEELASPTLSEPHGLDFLDEETLVVGNRGAGLAVYRLPAPGTGGELVPVGSANGHRPATADAPGSLAIRPGDGGRHAILACNNWANVVTRHELHGDGVLEGSEVVARKWLDLPDGIAISRDGQSLAVSNHDSHTVLVYEYATLSEDSDPAALLRGVLYPHGVRFASDDELLLVADAAAPFVHVFARPDDGWRGVLYPERSLRVMDDATFERGHHNPQEGGPKGIDVEPRANVLVVTAECVPLAFFDLGAGLRATRPDERVASSRLRYELAVQAEHDRAVAAGKEARALLAAIVATKSWRLLQPARRAYGAVARFGHRAP